MWTFPMFQINLKYLVISACLSATTAAVLFCFQSAEILLPSTLNVIWRNKLAFRVCSEQMRLILGVFCRHNSNYYWSAASAILQCHMMCSWLYHIFLIVPWISLSNGSDSVNLTCQTCALHACTTLRACFAGHVAQCEYNGWLFLWCFK